MKKLIENFLSLFHYKKIKHNENYENTIISHEKFIHNKKEHIFNWLQNHDEQYEININNHAYELIDIYDVNNELLLNHIIKSDNLHYDYFENLKKEGHQYIINVRGSVKLSFEEHKNFNKNMILISFETTHRDFKKYIQELTIKSKNFIPFKFHQIDENFDCSCNLLENLQNAPEIVIGSFDCSYNLLKDLSYSPSVVKKDFYCDNNQLISLKGSPYFIGELFNCSNNQLKNLEDSPLLVGSSFDCSYNQLISLKSKLNSILGHLNCSYNQLSSFQYCPETIHGNFDCSNNQISSLEFFPNMVDGAIIFKYSTFLFIFNNIGNMSLANTYLNNENLLKYKNESTDQNIQNMSDDDFFNQQDFLFWHQFYLQEKRKKENNQMIANLELNEKQENTQFIKKIKKV